VEVYITPKHGSKVTSREQFVDVLMNTWGSLTCRHDARYLWLQLTQSHLSDTVLETSTHKLFLNGLSLGTFVSPGEYHCHWKSAFCKTRETLTNATQNADSDGDDEDSSSNRLFAFFEHNSESLTITWKQMEMLHWRIEIPFDSLADRVLVVNQQGRTFHLFLFLANQPKIYRGEPRPRTKFHPLVDSISASETVWERDSCFESCDHQTFGSSNVLLLKLATLTQNLETLIRRLEWMNFAVYHSNPVMTDMEKSGSDLPCPKFQTFDASYAWFCLLSRGFLVSDQARSDEFLQLINASINNPQLGRVLEAVAAMVDCAVIFDLTRAFVEELETVQEEGTSTESVLKPVGDQFVSIRRLLITPSTVRGLPAQWCVGNRVVRQYGSDRFIRVVIRDEDLSLLSAANRLHRTINVITNLLRHDLLIGDRCYHFLGCSNSQLREHGLWMYASDAQGHSVEEIRRWMGDLSQERCVAVYMSRLGQFFSASRHTIEVDHVEMIPDVCNNGYCFTDGVGKISPLLAKKVIK